MSARAYSSPKLWKLHNDNLANLHAMLAKSQLLAKQIRKALDEVKRRSAYRLGSPRFGDLARCLPAGPRHSLHESCTDVSRLVCQRRARARGRRTFASDEVEMAELAPEPQSANDYDDRTTAAVKSVLLEIGQILGSFQGKFAVIGGAVPWLLLDNEEMPHVGTLDVDLGLDAEALGDGEYARLVELLMKHEYKQSPDLKRFQLVRQIEVSDGGNPIDIIVDLEHLVCECRAVHREAAGDRENCRLVVTRLSTQSAVYAQLSPHFALPRQSGPYLEY